jgi:enoyl-CoA hydratase/carnithine racemase
VTYDTIVPLGDVLRIALLGVDERMGAARALQVGLVTEVVPRESLWERADELAGIIAAKSPAAVQGSVKAIWESLDMPRGAAQAAGFAFTQVGNRIGVKQVEKGLFASGVRSNWTLR